MAGTPPRIPVPSIPPEDMEAVYRAHAGKCLALARRVVRDPHLAQDVVQEVFTILHRHPDRFDPARGSLSTWLMTLTHHKAVDVIRARRVRTGLDVSVDLASTVADQAPTPEDEASLNEERSRTRAALKVLTKVEREVIMLAYFEGYTQSQIATMSGIPLGTVKSRTLSALKRLRREITPDDRLFAIS
jgi:RNA polymerase sigma-70 factor (ECF subfamily)